MFFSNFRERSFCDHLHVRTRRKELVSASILLHEVPTADLVCRKKMAVNSLEESGVVDKLKTEESLPVVFQCCACNNIFGDSCAWVSSDRELEVICVNCK